MNFNYWVRRLSGRATCLLGSHAKLAPSARILNAYGDNKRINIGSYSHIAGELFVFAHGGNISIGDWCFVGEGTRIWSARSVSIGCRVLISHDVSIFDSLTHPLDAELRHKQFKKISTTGHPRDIDLGERSVFIDSDAWVGAGSFILRGVTIGKGAIIGAGSVVTRNVPAYAVVVGNPARIIRYLEESLGNAN